MVTAVERQPEGDPEWLLNTDPEGLFVADLALVEAGTTVRIFAGEAIPAIYGHRFYGAARLAIENGGEIHFMTGPIIVVDDNGFNPVLSLTADYPHSTRLYHLPDRGGVSPFRIVETREELRFHKALGSNDPLVIEPYYYRNLALLSQRDRVRLAIESRELFDGLAAELKAIWITDPTKLPLFTTTASGLRTLMAAAEASGRVYDFLGPEDFLALPGAQELLTKRTPV